MEAVETKKIAAQRVIAMQHAGSHDEIGKVYHELREWARAKGAALTGPGFTVFLSPASEFGHITGIQQFLVDQATANAQSKGPLTDELGGRIQVNAPNRNYVQLGQGRPNSFDQSRSANVRREQFNQIVTCFPGGQHLGGGVAAGGQRCRLWRTGW